MLPLLVLIFFITTSSHFSYTPDDTYIYLQFAKNIVHGNGISFNPGEPAYGFTSPLWLGIISAGGWTGIDVYVVAKATDLLIASLSLIVFYLLAFEIVRDIAVSLCATITFSVNAWFLRWAGTGMETSLSVLLVLAVMLYCFRNEYFISIIMAALLTLVRPEACLIVPVILLDVYFNSNDKRRALHLIAQLALIYVAAILPWLIYAYTTFGSIVPNTSAKAGFNFNLHEMYATFVDIAQTIGIADGLALVVAAVCGLILFIKRKTLLPVSEQDDDSRFFVFRQFIIGISWIGLVLLSYIIPDVNVVSRYLLLVIPFVTIFAFSLVYQLFSRSAFRRYVYGAIFALTALAMIQNQIWYQRNVLPGISVFEQGMETCMIPMGKWLKQNTSPDAKIVLADVGAIGYYSDRYVCDAAGLATVRMLPLLREGNVPLSIIEKKLYRSVCDVDYVIHRSPKPEALAEDHELIPLLTKPFFGLSLTEQNIIYYTLYKVTKETSTDHHKE